MFKVNTTINRKPVDQFVKEEERAVNTYKRGSPSTRKFLVNTIESFYKRAVESKTFTAPMLIVNKTFTGEEIGLTQSFGDISEYKRAIARSPEIKNQIVKTIRKQIRRYYADVKIENKKANRQIFLDTSTLNIEDIDARLDFTNAGLEVVFSIKEVALNRMLDKAADIYTKDHIDNENSISRLFYKHISDILDRTNNSSRYFAKLLQIGKEFEGKRAVDFSTILNRLTPGVNTLRAPNAKNINQLITGIHWSEEVRKQLDETTKQWNNDAEPPYLKKRTGSFIRSVTVKPDVIKQMLYFSFTPHYLRNEHFKYKVRGQVKEATEVVARRTIAKMWKIVYNGQ